MTRESIESRSFLYFFFQAEDGIRDIGVTGVQTCALPISGLRGARLVGVGDGLADHRPGAARPLEGQDRGVLLGQLRQLLHLGERRGLRHELVRVGRVGRVLVFHLRDQQLEEGVRSEEHTSELQSRQYLVCRLLLEKKNKEKSSTAKLSS